MRLEIDQAPRDRIRLTLPPPEADSYRDHSPCSGRLPALAERAVAHEFPRGRCVDVRLAVAEGFEPSEAFTSHAFEIWGHDPWQVVAGRTGWDLFGSMAAERRRTLANETADETNFGSPRVRVLTVDSCTSCSATSMLPRRIRSALPPPEGSVLRRHLP